MRVRACINAAAIRTNFRTLQHLAGKSALCAVVKANAYGHGLAIVAPALFDEGCRIFAVTDGEEALQLLSLLDAHLGKKAPVRVLPLSGAFDDAQASAAAADCRIEMLAFDRACVQRLKRAGAKGPIWIKLETGMHRLGADAPDALVAEAQAAGIEVAGLLSHLCCAATPAHPMNAFQIRRFEALSKGLRWPRSLANSAALIALPEACFDLARPGIALYGVNPVREKRVALEPAMRVEARIVQLRTLSPGDVVSYDAAFAAPRAMRVAIVSAGYADGIPRALSNCGLVVDANGRRLAIVGRVCMDYTIVDVSDAPELKEGDWLCFWGTPALRVEEQAEKAGTIPYELFTGISARMPRIEEEGPCMD